MLLEKPLFYYKNILKTYPNSYLAEDNTQIIIGIDCEYFQSDEISNLKDFFEKCKNNTYKDAPNFAGIFGVTAYESVYTFESLGEPKKSLYKFPNFYYANAKNYLHYDKFSKIYSFCGENLKIYENLKTLNDEKQNDEKAKKSELFYEISTNLDNEKSHFYKMIEKAKNYLKNGDIFQVVLGEILQITSNLDPLDFYEKLKLNNPSPYMFHFPTKYGTIVGSSPELVMSIKNSEIFIAPIAGTRKRGIDANADAKLKNELLSDEKELAEHKMLIDLARNDIAKFSHAASVRVAKPLEVVFYESVIHIISEVYGKKKESVNAFDTVKTIFPAGTPKIRAMQIINELESSARGIYGGGLGFWHFNNDAQMAILIRSAIFVPKNLSEISHENLSEILAENLKQIYDIFIGAGAGIVYDSKKENEYLEIQNKRNSCFKVIKELCQKTEKMQNNKGKNDLSHR